MKPVRALGREIGARLHGAVLCTTPAWAVSVPVTAAPDGSSLPPPPFAGASEPSAGAAVHLLDVGWTDVMAPTAVFSTLLRHLGCHPKITALSVPVSFASLKHKDIDDRARRCRRRARWREDLPRTPGAGRSGTGTDIVQHPAVDYVAEFVRHVNPRTAIKGAPAGPTA